MKGRRYKIMDNDIIQIIKGDITELEVDAIVNAANNSLSGGGGVDGAIHKKAGIELYEECRKLNGCMTGDAKITKGYNLKANFIIHTVAPMWFDSKIENKEELLAKCYKSSFELAVKNNIKTIAFPCLGMGAYEVPLQIGIEIAIDEAIKYKDSFDKIILVCFRDEEYEEYKYYYNTLTSPEYETEIKFKTIEEIEEYLENYESAKYKQEKTNFESENVIQLSYPKYDEKIFDIPKFLRKNYYISMEYYDQNRYPEFFNEDINEWDYEKLDIKRISYMILRTFNVERMCEGTIDKYAKNGMLLKAIKKAKELKEERNKYYENNRKYGIY